MNANPPSEFDRVIERRGTGCNKWDLMEALRGVPPEDGLAMWVADMDFRSPDVVNRALADLVDHGIWGYARGDARYHEAIAWWMAERHGWTVDPGHVETTFGVVNGLAVCFHAFTAPGDRIVIPSPAYHEFAERTAAAGREGVPLSLALEDGRYRFDLERWDAQMTGAERMLILCSPHNPGGRVWGRDELRDLAEFVRRHGLILVSDEIHADLVYPGHRHIPTAVACPEIADRLVTLTSASKTFNLPGLYNGNAIISDDRLRGDFKATKAGLGLGISTPGMVATRAAYSPEGAAWVDRLVRYLDGNRQLFDAGLAEIPGVRSMWLEATYLAWVDFSGTGLPPDEVGRRVQREARIATSPGPSFGRGGEGHLRFNLGMPRVRVDEAVRRLQSAFADLA